MKTLENEDAKNAKEKKNELGFKCTTTVWYVCVVGNGIKRPATKAAA